MGDKYSTISRIPCPCCNKVGSLRVANYGDHFINDEYRVTCSNCDFLSSTNLSDCGEVFGEFMREEYSKACIKYAEEKVLNDMYKESREELARTIGSGVTPTPDILIKYLEERSIINKVGRMGPSAQCNKEALRLAAVYLKDAYLDK